MSALMIAKVTVKNPAIFQEYLAKTKEVAAPYGAKLLFRGSYEKTLTGDKQDHGMTVIVQFPSLEKIHAWFESDAYQPLIPLREEGADIKMVSYEEIM